MYLNFHRFLLFFAFSTFIYSCSSPIFTQRKYFFGSYNANNVTLCNTEAGSEETAKEKIKQKANAETEKTLLDLQAIKTKEPLMGYKKGLELVACLNSETVFKNLHSSTENIHIKEKKKSQAINMYIHTDSSPALDFLQKPKEKNASIMDILELTSFMFIFASIVLLLFSNILWVFFGVAAVVLFILVQIIW
ncbi:MAG: hypothetical protein H0V01_05330 [Bacteroidetes bacterium]|nr:hypothetical protein [Bacteroidota bacterium]HET6243658.1 hypothetical protein [Bacteroidia bacterium]